MTINLDDALQTFLIEGRELLEQMEEALLSLEDEPRNRDAVNAIFRAAHTIKGSAGLFGLGPIVAFTHVAESVLDRVRDGEVGIDAELMRLLLAVRDHLGGLLEQVARGAAQDEDGTERGRQLTERLSAYLDSPAPGAAPAAAAAERGQATGPAAESGHWHLSLRFGPEVLRQGMDPLSFLRYLGTLGRIVHLATLTDALPAASLMDPEACYLGFELGFDSLADRAEIEAVFEFVREDSRIALLPPQSPLSAYRELIRALPEQDERLGRILVECGSLGEAELALVLADEPAASGSPAQDAALLPPPGGKAGRAADSQASVIRVDAQKLDRLINLIGELVIAGANVDLIAQGAGHDELSEAASNLSQLVEEVRDSALTLRMVPIGSTFNRFKRVVRDVGKELGKDIELLISGADTELDKTVVEKIGDPLTHLVRNAMDHGIEPAGVRRERGKPGRGRLHLDAYHDAGNIVIEVGDDGGGLDRERILAKALERGLVKEEQALTDKEIYQLIFEPGFSTASQVSNLSGRGVGMDVVARNIQALRGTVELDSEPGHGTRVRIRLPLTLAIIDGFLVRLGGAVYVVPQDLVVECIELPRAASERDFLNLRGEVLPYIRLRELFEVGGKAPERENVVVVQYAGQKAGLVVDGLLGEFQTVIKPLGRVFSRTNGIGGFTILGNGSVALILEVPGLVRQVVERANAGDNARLASNA